VRVAVIGAGGVGAYFGGRLAEAGAEVWFVARGAHLQSMKAGGLRVESVAGGFVVEPVRATEDPVEIGAVDFVLVAVKTWQLDEALRILPPLIGPQTAVVSLLNGVEAPAQIAERIGRQHVLPGSVRIFSAIDGPGIVRHMGGPASISFAEWDDRPSERVERLREVLRMPGVSLEVPDSIELALWEKFLFVVPMGSVGAVTRAPIGITRTLPGTRAMLEAGMEEIRAVGVARGIPFGHDVVERSMGFLDAQAPAGTSSL
jgi:2-dehydropantoate 2-reductase